MELIDLAHFRLSDLLQDIYPDEDFPQPASSQEQSFSDIGMQQRADLKRVSNKNLQKSSKDTEIQIRDVSTNFNKIAI